MHEASLMKSLMRQIDDIAQKEEAKRVVTVSVWLGALSHMSPDHFKGHFDEAAAGTIAEGARLEVETSRDIHHAHANDVILGSIEVET